MTGQTSPARTPQDLDELVTGENTYGLKVADTLPKLHPGGNVERYQPITRGDPDAEADVVVGQIHGGSAQGLGLAVMEEIAIRNATRLNLTHTPVAPEHICGVEP